jgi:hypothetical protein
MLLASRRGPISAVLNDGIRYAKGKNALRYRQTENELRQKKSQETYNMRDSPVITHLPTYQSTIILLGVHQANKSNTTSHSLFV